MQHHVVDLLSVLKIMAPVAGNETTSGITVLYNLYREHFKTHSCQILKGLIFDM